MNKFYDLHIIFRGAITLILLVLALLLIGIWFDMSKANFFYYLLIFLVVPIFQFCFTPFFRMIDVYQYLTPMMLVYNPSDEKYDLHNGTSFDYLFVMRNVKPGISWKQKILLYFVEGFLEIIRRIENDELPDTVVIRGSSYFFSSRSAERMGFEISQTGIGEKLNLMFNYLDLLVFYSLANGRLKFPNLGEIKTASTTGKQLVGQKGRFLRLKKMLVADR